jgi:hypothetical protein
VTQPHDLQDPHLNKELYPWESTGVKPATSQDSTQTLVANTPCATHQHKRPKLNIIPLNYALCTSTNTKHRAKRKPTRGKPHQLLLYRHRRVCLCLHGNHHFKLPTQRPNLFKPPGLRKGSIARVSAVGTVDQPLLRSKNL